MEIGEVKQLVENVDGWLTQPEGELLYTLAKNCTGRGVIVEIGSWKGKSTIWLGHGSKAGNHARICAIDPHVGSSEHQDIGDRIWTFDQFQENIRRAQVEDIVTPIVKTSESAARNFDQPIELIFIDGAHEYELVKLDLELWFPKVVNGGIMAFHDTAYRTPKWPGPKKLVEDLVYKSKNFKDVRQVDSITLAEKVQQNSVGDRLRNRYNLWLKYAYEKDLANKLYNFSRAWHLPKMVRRIGKKLVQLLQLS